MPLKAGNKLSALEVANARKSEAVFQEVKKAILGCADYLSKNLSDTASDHATNRLAREYLADSLNQKSNYKLVRLMDESYFGAGVYASAISAALMSSNPWLGVAVPAALTPRLFFIAEQKIGLQSRAWAKVNALL